MSRSARLLLLCTLAACGNVTAPLLDAPPEMVTLTVTHSGNASGSVISSPTGINCGAACTLSVTAGTTVTLTAAADSTATFAGWSGGGCTGTSTTCTVTVSADTSVDAAFSKQQFTITVTPSGGGTGSVVSTPAGIDCGSTCNAKFDSGTSVTLTPTAGASSTFVGWSGGGCTGTGPCTVVASADTTVTAMFALNDELDVLLAGTGTGTVTSTDTLINCGTGAGCMHQYAPNAVVTLNAAADISSTFTGWSGGGCAGTGNCVVTISAATSVTATFTLKTVNLTLPVNGGNGAGTVTPTPAGTSCGANCYAYDYGKVVSIAAAASTGSTFAGFSGGGCGVTTPCSVTVTANTTVTATFTLNKIDVTLATAGAGTGTIAIAPAGTSCGGTCHEYNYGAAITITASPGAGSSLSTFAGEGCTTTNPCVTSATTTATVTATFTINNYTLTVAKAGTGGGAVTSVPAGISCGASCTKAYPYNTPVVLTVIPNAGSFFAGWTGGGCTGSGNCTVTMTANTTVTATFTKGITETWDPFWSQVGTVNFTGGNLSIAAPNNPSNTEVRGQYGKSSGRWYWEVTATNGDGNMNGGGLGISDQVFPNTAAWVGSDANSLGFGYNGGNQQNYFATWSGVTVNGAPPAISGVNKGNVYMFALDMNTGSFWAGMNGTWFNSGDPANALNPAAIGITGIVYPAVVFYSSVRINSFTANFGGSAFMYAVPAGYNPGLLATPASFAYTGANQTYTVPVGVTHLRLETFGAQGSGQNSLGGLGGYAAGNVDVTAGQVLTVVAGGDATGFNGGGPGAATSPQVLPNGGGASDIRLGGAGLGNRILVAGGGGGGGNGSSPGLWPGGAGGGGTCGANYCGGGGGAGYPSAPAGNGQPGALAGGAGVTAAHGGGGGGGGFNSGGGASCETNYPPTACGAAGTLGQGGASDSVINANNMICFGTPYDGTAGGGGGFYGGGGTSVGNCGGGAGGGGSSFTGSLASPTMLAGVRGGDGQVTITPQ